MDTFLTVSKLNLYIKNIIEEDIKLTNVVVKGEISNLIKHYTGHYYFSLKDENSKISCMMFSSYVKKLKKDINNGDEVILYGYISCYEKLGTYQLYVKNIEPFGQGLYLLKLEELKKRLKEEGIFDKEKKFLPKYPNKIGLITSKSGAAIKDFIHTIKSRYFSDIYIFPCSVQGENAPETIIKALVQADNYGLDIIIIGRGGGANEDLKAFNDENLVRTVYDCKTPIISAVGHQIDTTLVDFVSDVVAITPTDAGEKATPDKNILHRQIRNIKDHLKLLEQNILDDKNQKLMALISSNKMIDPREYLINFKKRINLLSSNLAITIQRRFEESNHKRITLITRTSYLIHGLLIDKKYLYEKTLNKVKIYNPNIYLEKGYSYIKNDENEIINSINKVSINDKIKLELKDGYINAIITQKGTK